MQNDYIWQLLEDTVLQTADDGAGFVAYETKNYPILGLVSEVGELASELKKIERNDRGIIAHERRNLIKGEVGDILWYLMAFMLEHDFDPGDIIRMNRDKLLARKAAGTIKSRP